VVGDNGPGIVPAFPNRGLKMTRYLVFIDCGTISQIDDALGAGVDSGVIDHYAVITENGAPILYDQSGDPASDYLNTMGAACMGVTEND